MAFRIGANTTNNVRALATNAIVGALNTGSTYSTAVMNIYTGAQPATPETTASGTLLVSIPFEEPAFGSADATGTAGLAGSTPISATVTTSGTAGWFRVVDRSGYEMFDGSISTSGSDINFSSVSFVAGGTATITSLTIQSVM